MAPSRAARFIAGFVAVGFAVTSAAASFEWWQGAWPWGQNEQNVQPQKARDGSGLRPHARHCSPYMPWNPKIDDVLRQADRIVLAKVRSVRPNPKNLWVGNNVIYKLGVVMVVKGKDAPSEFELAGVKPNFEFPFDPALLDATYRHAELLAKAVKMLDASPLRRRIQPLDALSYCEYAPYFETGINYLIVLPEPYTAVSFEPILTYDDAWLERVERGYGNKGGNGNGLY